jgi:16S rRNA processing protein RimM
VSGPGGGPDGAVQLPAGRVGRAHGLDGSFYVTGAHPRLLALGATVTIAGRAVEIVRRAGSDMRPIVRLRGVEDRVAAEALRGQPLTVAGAEAPALDEGEWWAHELEGCRIVDGLRHVGVVTRLIELPSCEALEVTREAQSGSEYLLVPMVKDAIRSVDVDAGVIDVNMTFIEE